MPGKAALTGRKMTAQVLKSKKKQPLWFELYKGIIGLFVAKPRFIHLGGGVEEPSLLISNHEGAAGPLTWEIRWKGQKKFWVAHENTEGIKAVFRYLAYLYFPQKKHLPKLLSVVVAFITCPFVSLFFKGLDPLPTYTDAAEKLISTIRRTESELVGGSSIVIFPEDSSHGYFKKPKRFFAGFVLLCERLLKNGVDVQVFVTYFSKKRRTVIFDKPVRYSVLRRIHGSREVIAERLRQRLCELADMEL